MKQIVIIVGFVLSVLLVIRIVLSQQSQKQYRAGDSFHEVPTLLSEPTKKGSKQEFMVKGVLVSVPLYPQYHYGDTIDITGIVKKVSLNQSNAQNYDLLVVNKPQATVVQSEESTLLLPFQKIRLQIASVFSSTLPKKEAGLLMGVVFGIKDGLPSDFYTELKNTGTLHVVAASGMNVTMVGGFLLAFFCVFLPRRIGTLAAIGGIVFYAILSGLEPSIVRAALMGIFSFAAFSVGRQNFSFLGLGLAIYIMLFYDPTQISNPGFLLSVGSTAGILGVKPVLDFLIEKVPFHLLTEDFSTSLAAQIGSLPILISAFSSYAVLSILVNMLVLWTIPFLMIFGSIAAVVGLFVPFFASPFLWISYPLLVFFEWMIDTFSHIGGLVTISLPFALIAGYYCFVIAIVLLFQKRVARKEVDE